ncbi:lipoxygenase [Ceratobasidium sp. AG-Ba]|nr:lipoxygenase [Ceratobasidium sp. AG-Ba]
MSSSGVAAFPPPLIYVPPAPSQEAAEKEAQTGLEANKNLYKWKSDDGYPPHVDTVPEADNKTSIEIFNVQALLQTKGMLLKDDEISANYFRLAPDPKVPTSFDDLIKHNQSLRAPPGVENNMLFRDRRNKDWYSDAVFAQQFFTGTNPTTIKLANEWIPAFQDRAKADGNTEMLNLLRTAPASSLYVQDYSYFRPAMGISPDKELASGTSGNIRYGCAPVALFQLGDNGRLHPLAIVIDYKGSMASSVVIFNKRLTPTGNLADEAQDWPWRYAKTCVQSADWLRHEVSIHLVNTHLVEEATIVAAHRTLPPHHIVFQLLKKHWETTLPLNREARGRLVPEVITALAGVKKDDLSKLLNHAYASFDWSRLLVPKDLESRGFPVADLEKSPKFHNYAYARNIALMWTAIRSFVSEILRPSYPGGDEHVASDPYLKAFCEEMRSSKGAQMSTFPEIKTLDELIDIATMCIHIASPQHTAVNYLQHYYQVFVPNKPWALYKPLPRSLSELKGYGEKQLLNALPFKQTKDWLIGAQLPYLLSFEVIGESSLIAYAQDQLNNPIEVIAKAANSFKEELKVLQKVFKAHSKELDDQDTRYMVMDPSITAVSILI